MTLDLGKVRPPVLRTDTADRLDELRRFRHLVRNIYAANLVPGRIGPIVEGLPELWVDVRSQLNAFGDYLEEMSHADEE